MITMAKAFVEKMERSSTNIEFGENVSLNEKLRLFVLRNETRLANVGSLDFYFSFFFSLSVNVGHVSVVLNCYRSKYANTKPNQH